MEIKDQKTQMIAENNKTAGAKSIKLNKLSPKQNSLLKSTIAGVSGISLGALLAGFIPKTAGPEDNEDPLEDLEDGSSADVQVSANAPFSDVVSDEMSFSEAFSAARADLGAGGLFDWHGQTYTTYYEGEWQSAAVEAKLEFIAFIDDGQIDSEITDEDEILNILNDETSEIDEIDILNDTEDIVINEAPDASEVIHVIDDSSDDMDDDLFD